MQYIVILSRICEIFIFYNLMPNLLGIISQIFARCSCRRRPKTVDKLKSAAHNQKNNKSSSTTFWISNTNSSSVNGENRRDRRNRRRKRGHNFFGPTLCLRSPHLSISLSFTELVVIKLLPISFCTFRISFSADTLCVWYPHFWQDCQIYIEMPGDYS